MGGSNTKPDKEYPTHPARPEIDPESPYPQRIPPRPPVSPSNQNTQSRSIPNKEEGNTYLSRFVEDIPEDRLHKSKTRSMKLNQSLCETLVQTKVKVNQNFVTVRQQKPLLNSHLTGTQIPGFSAQEFHEKKFKKFSINALIKEKTLIKESNYFDESHLAETDLAPVVNKRAANFNVGEIEEFETVHVKTYLYDRNLSQKNFL